MDKQFTLSDLEPCIHIVETNRGFPTTHEIYYVVMKDDEGNIILVNKDGFNYTTNYSENLVHKDSDFTINKVYKIKKIPNLNIRNIIENFKKGRSGLRIEVVFDRDLVREREKINKEMSKIYEQIEELEDQSREKMKEVEYIAKLIDERYSKISDLEESKKELN